MSYQPTTLEPKWQKYWDSNKIFKASDDFTKPKYYALDMFPYPSAAGLHVGHALGYTATDIVSRYYRMKGHNVLHPMGWDAFGLPAEQHAIETGEHPSKLTYRNIDNFRVQLKKLGMGYDWDREVFTCEKDYYHWTQWIFKLLYDRGLAYQAEMFVNWCPALKTVLANEEIVDGKSERGGHPVSRVPMRQWMLKITSYAERLLADLDKLDWPESTKEIQRNWIGKSVGARVKFRIKSHAEESISVFTTRPDTLFGATYLVLAPEHALVDKITTPAQRAAVNSYREVASKKSDMDRTELNKDKSGEFTGAYAQHPITGADLPIWISDYVLVTYGTGAIMAVPAHDERDHEFAKKFGLKIVQVVAPNETKALNIQEESYSGDGHIINSDFINDMSVADAKNKMISYLEDEKLGEGAVSYRFRDWLFSRQRYWGEPLPILKDSKGHIVRSLREDELPLTLPEVQSYHPTDDGKSPLANLTSWVQKTDKDGNTLFHETDTMPGAAGSSWYFLRYCDPHNTNLPFSFDKAKYWMPVDLYVGGPEHAVGHLLFSRFWTKVLFDAGYCPVDEPFQRLVHQGMICRNGAKMSKSKGNGVSPDQVMEQYGADALRVYEVFMGPLSQTKEWDDANLAGMRFLNRIEKHMLDDQGKSLVSDEPASKADLKIIHKTIKKISEDIPQLSFNTSISTMMIFLNHIAVTGCRNREVMGSFLKVLSPFAPHLAEELWHKCILQEKSSPDAAGYRFLSIESWPSWDAELVVDDEVTLGVQVNGKHRGEITVPNNASQEVAVAAAFENATLKALLEGKTLRRTIYVANRILNFVI
jgi:leucyl-tRNA synthetase